MKILVADDHPLFRSSLVQLVQQLDTDAEISQAGDYPSAVSLCADHHFALAVVDLCMPGFDNGEALCQLRENLQGAPLVVVSAIESKDHIHKTLAMGIQGYILKSSTSEILLSALRLVLAGGCYVSPVPVAKAVSSEVPPRYNPAGLTDREIDVLRLLAEGLANKEIARRLQISQTTVKTHITSVYRTLDVHNRTQASRAAEQLGLL